MTASYPKVGGRLPTPFRLFSSHWLAHKSSRWALHIIPPIRASALGNCAAAGSGIAMLLEAKDEHFAWMLGGPPPKGGLRLPADGVDAPSVIKIVRRMAVAVRASYGPGCWMIVVDSEIVGLCSYKGPPDQTGSVEIGYSVASSHQQRGYATRAVALLFMVAQKDRAIRFIVAETTTENLASQRVLERNGFAKEGKRDGQEEGEVVLWRRDLSDLR